MKKPFFAKFMENQIAKQVKAGSHADYTEKYPSDVEEIGNGEPCNGPAAASNPHCLPVAVTLKYPCDAADAGQPC